MADHRRHGEGSGAPHLLAAAILLLSDGLGTGIGFAGRRGGGCAGEEARRLVDAGPTFMAICHGMVGGNIGTTKLRSYLEKRRSFNRLAGN